MSRPSLPFGPFLLLLLLGTVTCALAQDWPQWRGPNRDGVVTGFTPPQDWSTALSQVWKVPVGIGPSTPALVGDRLYVFARQGGDEVTLCLDAATGAELWRDAYPALQATGPAARHSGPRSSPAVAEGKVVTLGIGGVLSCLDAATGALIWRKDPFPGITPRFYTSSSPIIVDGMAIAHLGGPGNGALIAFDLATGDEKWRWAGEGPEYGSPVLMTVDGTPQVVTLTEASLVGVSVTDGELLWQVPFMPQGRSYNASTPIIHGQTVIYSAAQRGTHAVTIRRQDDEFVVTPAWSNPEIGVQFSTPVVFNGMLFGLSERGTLFCLDAESGVTLWEDDRQWDRGTFGPVVHVGSAVLVLPSNGELLVIEPTDSTYTLKAQIKVADTPTYAHPVVSGNRIFIKDQDSVALWIVQ